LQELLIQVVEVVEVEMLQMVLLVVLGLLLFLTHLSTNLLLSQELALKQPLAETTFLLSLVLEPSLSNLFKGAI